MYQNTRFHDFIKGLSRSVFNKMVQRHQSDKHSKGFGSWDHLIAMVYCQVSGASSLRELEAGFNSQAPHHYHLGTRAIKRSTLCDANANRPAAIFEDVCKHLMQSAHRKLKNDLDDLLYLIDSSGITLKGQGFDDWTAHSPGPGASTRSKLGKIIQIYTYSCLIYISVLRAVIFTFGLRG